MKWAPPTALRIPYYERAVNERTRLLLRVHPSNFRISGFTERPALEDIVALGRRLQLPVFEHSRLGLPRGSFSERCLRACGRREFAPPAPRWFLSAEINCWEVRKPESSRKKEIVERIRRNPLFRALRVDKLMIAALEVTLQAYLRSALDEIPTLRMIRLNAQSISERATKFLAQLKSALSNEATCRITPGFSVIGGGSTPDQQLPTALITISSARHSAAELERRLRKPANGTSVIARIEDDQLILDFRTVPPGEESELVTALAAALN